MQDNFGLKIQNSQKLPHMHARLDCHVNEKNREKDYSVLFTNANEEVNVHHSEKH